MPEKSLLDEAADAVYRDLDAVGGDPLRLSPEVTLSPSSTPSRRLWTTVGFATCLRTNSISHTLFLLRPIGKSARLMQQKS